MATENRLMINLLFTNTTILHKASSLLYGSNRFNLTARNFELIPKFLDASGVVNSSHIKCIRIDCPELRDLEDESVWSG